MDSKKVWTAIILILDVLFVFMLSSALSESDQPSETYIYRYRGSTQSKPSSYDAGSYNYNSSSGASSGGTRNYSVDPDDYDNPDDFADDAYGIDFDDYDDAYDYWEDY